MVFLGCMLAGGIMMTPAFVALHSHLQPGRFRAALREGCPKCGGSELALRWCDERCTTRTPDADGRAGAGGQVVWPFEHLHRTCKRCACPVDAIEVLDVLDHRPARDKK